MNPTDNPDFMPENPDTGEDKAPDISLSQSGDTRLKSAHENPTRYGDMAKSRVLYRFLTNHRAT
jgi:hypothetical protein